MNKLLCFAVYSGAVDEKEPIGWCIMGAGILFYGDTLEEAKQEARVGTLQPNAEFLENCGWVVQGEEEKLLDDQYADLLLFNIRQRLKAEGEPVY